MLSRIPGGQPLFYDGRYGGRGCGFPQWRFNPERAMQKCILWFFASCLLLIASQCVLAISNEPVAVTSVTENTT